MSINRGNILGPDGAGGGGLSEAEVDARVVAVTSGKRSFWVGIDEFRDGGSANPGALTSEWTISNSAIPTRAYDPTTVEVCERAFAVPAGIDGALGMSFTPYWLPATTNTGNVRWELQLISDADGATFANSPVGDSCYSDDVGQGVADALQIGPESNTAFTGDITPGHLLIIRAKRAATDAADTFTGDAKLIGFMLHWHTSAPTDD